MTIQFASGPGGHPEVGDMVYKADGSELGKISFFHAPVREDVWGVKIGDDPEDHNITVIKRIPGVDSNGKVVTNSDGSVAAWGLVRLNEPFVDNNRKTTLGKPAIAIENNVGTPVNIIAPQEN